MENELDQVDWKELGKGWNNQPVHPDMFSDNGYVAIKEAKPKGAKHHETPRLYKVSYNSEYAMYKLSSTLFSFARYVQKDKFLTIIEKVWEMVNDQNPN
ncbi:hypothetical protein [Chamaesiphon sp.]|uniref:hypothetical protein n=1 Tax=Chamaesiphon sp. TaxID=2814140 RepID=UPI0035941996